MQRTRSGSALLIALISPRGNGKHALAAILLSSACVFAWPMEGDARSLVPEQPSVELYLDVLDALRPAPRLPPPPPPGFASGYSGNAPFETKPRPVATRKPAPRPAPRVVSPKPAPKPQPKVAAPVKAPPAPPVKPVEAPPPAPALPKPALPKPAAPKPIAPPPAAPIPAPAPAPTPAPVPLPAPPKPEPAPAPKPAPAPEAKAPAVSSPPAAPGLAPMSALPEVSMPQLPPAPSTANLDFSKLPPPKPVAAPTVAPTPAKESKAAEILRSLNEAPEPAPVPPPAPQPTLAPMPPMPALPAPAKPTPDVLVQAPATPPPSKPVPAGAIPPLPEVVPPADPALKNLTDRVNTMFVKEPEKQGILSDKKTLTGAPQNQPKLPTVPPAPVHAPKPKQMTLEEVNKAVPPEKLRATPSMPPVSKDNKKPQPIEVPPKPEAKAPVPAKPVPVAEAKPSFPMPTVAALTSATANAPTPKALSPLPEPIPDVPPSPSPKEATASILKAANEGQKATGLKLPTLAEFEAQKAKPQTLETKTKDTKGIASADSLDALLPPPRSLPKPGALPPISELGADGSPSGLPPLTPLLGKSRSSMDIVTDQEGVRSAALPPPSLPTSDSTLPKITRGPTEPVKKPVEKPPEKTLPKPVAKPVPKPVPAPAVASPEVKASIPAAPTPVADPAKPAAPKPDNVARAVKIADDAGSPTLSIPFEREQSEVLPDMQAQIGELVKELSGSQKLRIIAYASGKPEEASAARRVSLSRALQVRAKLIEKGVDPMQITVQALGNTAKGGNPDRADVVVQ
jgi:outer membrane protein OmpA-like peptidoglycan-associated protein